jgi:hypothetical protein
VQTKRKLLDDCGVWAIVCLSSGVFTAAGAGVKTNLALPLALRQSFRYSCQGGALERVARSVSQPRNPQGITPQGFLHSLFCRGGVSTGVYRDILALSARGYQLRPPIWVSVADRPKLMNRVSYRRVVAQGNQAHYLLLPRGQFELIGHSVHLYRKENGELT